MMRPLLSRTTDRADAAVVGAHTPRDTATSAAKAPVDGVAGTNDLSSAPRTVAQRQRFRAAFGPALQRLPDTQRAGPVFQRAFAPATTSGKSHLRHDGAWGVHVGPAIPKNAQLLVDADAHRIKNVVGSKAQWRPAINVPPNHLGPVAADRIGYIRSSKATIAGGPLEAFMRGRIQGYLRSAENSQPNMAGHLDKADHIQFLLDKALRYDSWSDGQLDSFATAFGTLQPKFDRIRDGADYVARVLEHWRAWLHPENAAAVTITEVELVKSDLHERGLGVVKVKFTKPVGALNTQFGPQTAVTAFIKPEDKSLEQNLLGDNANSAASKINRIARLRTPTEKLQTIKMESTALHGTLVEAARGASAEALNRLDSTDKAIGQSFHETLIFAYLSGIDDLHYKNVYWDAGAPTLIDADNVLSRNQMEGVDNGAFTQSGFGSNYNRAEADKNKAAITGSDNSQINSKILQTMLTKPVKRRQIIAAIRAAIQGHRGRVVPIRTNHWGGQLRSYPTMPNRDGFLDRISNRQFLVREMAVDGVGFVADYGPGLFGVAGKNVTTPFYDPVAERAQAKQDFDSGVIPFYEYEFDTGYVTHNGVKIYHGQTLNDAMTAMLNKFGG